MFRSFIEIKPQYITIIIIVDLEEELTSQVVVEVEAGEDVEVEEVAEEEERRNLLHLLKNLIKNWIPT